MYKGEWVKDGANKWESNSYLLSGR
jgi:hypothetical protein